MLTNRVFDYQWLQQTRFVARNLGHAADTHVHCGQMAGWIKMAVGTEVGLGPGHIVVDGEPAPLPQKGTAPNFRSISVVPKWLGELRCH